jgi:hypothetical protein
MVNGARVSTPYCQDEALAAHQRKQGSKVTGSEIRSRPDLKREACTLALPENDTACAGYTSD